jgi:hypothetical protein
MVVSDDRCCCGYDCCGVVGFRYDVTVWESEDSPHGRHESPARGGPKTRASNHCVRLVPEFSVTYYTYYTFFTIYLSGLLAGSSCIRRG